MKELDDLTPTPYPDFRFISSTSFSRGVFYLKLNFIKLGKKGA